MLQKLFWSWSDTGHVGHAYPPTSYAGHKNPTSHGGYAPSVSQANYACYKSYLGYAMDRISYQS